MVSKSFRNLDTVATLYIKRQNAPVELIIQPKKNFSDFPDTLQTYTPVTMNYSTVFYRKDIYYRKPYLYIREK